MPRRASTWVGWTIRLVAAGLLGYVALRVVQLWRDSEVSLGEADPWRLGLTAVVSVAAVMSYGYVWPMILRLLGGPVPGDAVGLFLQSQLGKYLPGSLWHFAGRIGLARSRGVSVRTASASLLVEVVASALAAALVASFVLPIRVGLPIVLAMLACLAAVTGAVARRRLDRGLARRLHGHGDLVRTVLISTWLYLPVWALYGVALWLTASAFGFATLADLAFFAGAFAVGWLAGMAVVFAPGGIGVREVVLIALLGPRIGHAEAVVVAATSRVLLTGADLGGGALGLWLSRRNRYRTHPYPPSTTSGPAAT